MIKIWNKLESINGVSAEDYISNTPAWMLNGDVLLIVDEATEIVTQIQNVNQLRVNLSLDSILTSEEVGQAYLNSLNPTP